MIFVQRLEAQVIVEPFLIILEPVLEVEFVLALYNEISQSGNTVRCFLWMLWVSYAK